MSCERGPSKVASLAPRAGVARLASKKAFYLGVAAGLAGIVGSVLLARRPLAEYRSRLRRLYRRQAALVNPRELPEMPAQPLVAPTPRDRLSGKCAACGSLPGSKPGVWYVLDGQPYCQDCAPQAARQAGQVLQKPAAPPEAPPRVAAPSASTRVPVKALAAPGQGGTPATPLNPQLRRETTLQRRAILVKSMHPASGEIRSQEVQGFEILATQGRAQVATGLAAVPADGGWTLTHMLSGRKIAGPYELPAEVQQLASVLAQLDWATRDPLIRFSSNQRAQIAATITYYDAALQEAKEELARQGAPGDADEDEDDGELDPQRASVYDQVQTTAHHLGFQKGYNAGVEEAMQELGFESGVDVAALEAEWDTQETEALEELKAVAGPIWAEDYDMLNGVYEQATEDGWSEGYDAGYGGTMARFGSPRS